MKSLKKKPSKKPKKPKKPPIEIVDPAKVFIELPGLKVITKRAIKTKPTKYVNISSLLWISPVYDIGGDKGQFNRFRIYFYAGVTGKQRFTAYFDTYHDAEAFHKQYVKPLKDRGYK